ncbi:MAG: TRAP transporter substrate-binding protein DctP, partial [Burkholderiaceae bacterium]|nr:TRAP transporter substrate-binding protein DctP [Burkholderiaceae bacterium]
MFHRSNPALLWLLAAVLALALAISVSHADSGTVLLRFSHVVAQDTPKGMMASHFKELVAQRSGGRIRVEVYCDSQLYGDDDEMEALRLGAVEMLAPSLSKFGNYGLPEFEVFDLPFLFDNLAQVRRVTQGPVGQQLLQRLGRQQMLGLG